MALGVAAGEAEGPGVVVGNADGGMLNGVSLATCGTSMVMVRPVEARAGVGSGRRERAVRPLVSPAEA